MISLNTKISRENRREIEKLVKSLEVLRCDTCAKQLPEQSDSNLCNTCYIKEFGQFCHNCEEMKYASDFSKSKSVMCEECFDRKPRYKMKAIRAAVSNVFYASQRNKAKLDYENELGKCENEIKSQQHQIDLALRKLEDVRHTLKLVHTRYHDYGVELSDDVAEDLDLDEPTKRVMPFELAAITHEYKMEVQHLKQRFDSACDKYAANLQAMDKLETEKEHTIAEHSQTLRKYQVSNDLVSDLLNMIFEGTLSKMEMLTKLFEKEGISTRPDTICPAYVSLTRMYNEFELMSDGLKDLEIDIRNGEDKVIADLIPSKNPLQAWFNQTVVLDEESKVSSTKVYASYTKFAKDMKEKPLSDRVFPKQFLELFDKNDGVVKVKSDGKMFFRGINLDEQDENTDDE